MRVRRRPALAEDINSAAAIASALRMRVLAHIATGDVGAAHDDIDRALAGIGTSDRDAYINEQRAHLQKLRATLAGGASA